MKTLRDWFLLCGHAEGISYLALLFIAMPMKYMGGMPLAVTIVGALHGMLFIAFVSLLWEAKRRLPMSWRAAAVSLVLAVVPFGTFFLYRVAPVESKKG
jgi:integral membrane protein